MIYCSAHNFLFLRIPKNASTSLATFFIKSYCGPDDIYTAVGDSGIKTQNIRPQVIEKYKTGYRFIHLTLQEILDNQILTYEELHQKKIIGVLRDPFDRQLSLYFFLMRNNKSGVSPANFREMFSRGFCAGDPNNTIFQSDYLELNNITAGEYWLYENLDAHLSRFIYDNMPKKVITLPHYKAHLRKNLDRDRLIDEYYDIKTKQAVANYFRRDIELYETLKNELH